MSKADKMFEELGYEKIEEKDYIAYIEKTEPSPFRTEIYFHTDKRLLQIHGCINAEELQAINEKVKELGWNDRSK